MSATVGETKTILVAVDGSPRAASVLDAAAAIAKGSPSRLLLLRVVGLPTELPVEAYLMAPDEVTRALRERARRELEWLAARAGVPCDIRVEVGAAWQTICDVGKIENAALIVVGSHGYSGIDHILGTTAAKIVNHADRSVLVVRGAPASPPAAPSGRAE